MASRFARPAALIPVLAALAFVSLVAMVLAAEDGHAQTGASATRGAPNGTPWNTVIGEPLNISATAGMSQGAAAASDPQGDVIVAWSDFTSGGADVMASVSDDGGVTWSPAVNVSNDAIASTSPAPWISPAGAGVAWLSQPGAASVGTLTAAFLPVGGIWDPSTALDDDVGTEFLQPVVNDDPNDPLNDPRVVIGYIKQTLLGEEFIEATSTDGGDTFGTPAKAPFSPSQPPVGDTAGSGWAVELKPDGSIEVWKAHYNDSTHENEWSLDRTIQAGARNAWIEPGDAHSDQSDTIIVYWETKVPPVQIMKSVYDVAGGTWSDPEPVSDGSHSASGPDFDGFGEYGIFIWFQINPVTQHSQVMGRASTDGGQTFGEPVEITPPDVGASDAFVIIDVDGIAYIQFDAQNGSSSHRELVIANLKDFAPDEVHLVFPLNMNLDLTNMTPAWVGAGVHNQVAATPQTLEARVLLLGTMPPEGDYVPDIFVARTGLAGDGDCNGVSNAVDALAVLRSVAGLPSTAGCLALTNVNCSGGAANSVDALLILRSVAGLPVNVPTDCPSVD